MPLHFTSMGDIYTFYLRLSKWTFSPSVWQYTSFLPLQSLEHNQNTDCALIGSWDGIDSNSFTGPEVRQPLQVISWIISGRRRRSPEENSSHFKIAIWRKFKLLSNLIWIFFFLSLTVEGTLLRNSTVCLISNCLWQVRWILSSRS